MRRLHLNARAARVSQPLKLVSPFAARRKRARAQSLNALEISYSSRPRGPRGGRVYVLRAAARGRCSPEQGDMLLSCGGGFRFYED